MSNSKVILQREEETLTMYIVDFRNLSLSIMVIIFVFYRNVRIHLVQPTIVLMANIDEPIRPSNDDSTSVLNHPHITCLRGCSDDPGHFVWFLGNDGLIVVKDHLTGSFVIASFVIGSKMNGKHSWVWKCYRGLIMYE